jgi:hypothetical protein
MLPSIWLPKISMLLYGVSGTVGEFAQLRGRETWTMGRRSGLIPANSPRLAVHVGILAQPTCRAEIEILQVARATMDHVLPLCIRLDVFVLG